MRRHADLWMGLALGLLVVVLLSLGHRSVGYARDEGIYFEASRRYAAWFERAPGEAMQRKVRDAHFGFNHEHPALMKIAGGLSARALAEPTVGADPSGGGIVPLMPEGAAMRLPAQILAGLGALLLFVTGRRLGGSRWAGLLAAGSFVALPHVWFHAGLHAFDVPIAVAILAVVLVYRRALVRPGYGLALGPLLGVAIAIKHNALFVGPLLALHLWGCLLWTRRRHGVAVPLAAWFPLPLVSMLVAAPVVAWALWPWLWHDPWNRLLEYFAFHQQHSWYNMEFLGVNYNQPPMPVAYPFVMTWATVPTAILLLALVGLLVAMRSDPPAPASPSFRRPLPGGSYDGWLFAMFFAFPIALIALPSTPIFGGTKHFLTAFPFASLAAAIAWKHLFDGASAWRASLGRTGVRGLALAIVLGPTILATVDGHPYGLSQYAPLAGGPRGAAELGLNRGFWGHAVVDLLPHLRERGGVWLHDVHELARLQYEREGRWPPGAKAAPLTRADAALLFHELHMTADETRVWNDMGTTAPIEVIELDDVPLTSLYAED